MGFLFGHSSSGPSQAQIAQQDQQMVMQANQQNAMIAQQQQQAQAQLAQQQAQAQGQAAFASAQSQQQARNAIASGAYTVGGGAGTSSGKGSVLGNSNGPRNTFLGGGG